MADNFVTDPGSGGVTFAGDDITGVQYPILKLAYGVLDSATLVSASAGLPVAQQGTWNITNVSGTVSLPTGAATAAKQPALGTAGSASADVITVQGVASMTALKVDGSAVTQPVSAASLPLPTGAATAAKQPALGTAGTASADVLTVQGIASMTALKVDGSAVTQPVSAASLPLPTGASTAAKQPALGTAGTASSDVLTVQGIASMTALKVDGSAVTQPVSGTVTANVGTTNGLALDATLTGGTQKTIARGGAKGTTSAADVTSTASGVNHQPLDVVIYDTSGNAITSFGGTGGTSSSYGSSFPSTGTAVGFSDGTNMQAGHAFDADSGAGTQYVQGVLLAVPASGGAAIVPGDATNGLKVQVATMPTTTVTGTVTANIGTTNGLALDATLTGGTQQTKITDGTNVASVKAASTAAVATDKAVVVAVSPNNTVAVTESGTWTVQPGNTANTTPWLSTNVAPSNGTTGWSFNYQSALAATKQQIKGSAGTFGGYLNLMNPNTTDVYIQVFNKASASVTVGTTAPDYVIRLPGLASASGTGVAANLEISNGIAHSTGITVAATTTATGSTAPANALTATFLFL